MLDCMCTKNTVSHTELHNLWGGKVIIDEVRQYTDARGNLVELWRSDDLKTHQTITEDHDGYDMEKCVRPVMSYWSITNPYVMRGPHEHLHQTDFFISWNSKMIYQLYNKDTNEMFTFITDPQKVYRVKVAPPIIHSYRNLESKPSTTGNFPTALFMGRDKKEAIDEIRHEEITENVPTFIVFGANGRLGKSFVNELYSQIGFHKYNVIPIYDKIDKNNIFAINDMFKNLSKVTYEKVFFINCSGVTNVQKSDELADDMRWTNTELPVLFAGECSSRGWNMIQFSSDYIFQQINKNGDPLSSYTMSKKEMEDRINILDSDVSKNIAVTIVRVANLFSTDETDTHNMIKKIEDRLKLNGSITIDPNLIVTPTDVDIVSKTIVTSLNNSEDLYITNSGVKNVNLISKTPYNLRTLINKFYKCDNIKETIGQLDPWFDNFNKEDSKTTIKEIESSDNSIKKILKI